MNIYGDYLGRDQLEGEGGKERILRGKENGNMLHIYL
jgi:hypothetical protein